MKGVLRAGCPSTAHLPARSLSLVKHELKTSQAREASVLQRLYHVRCRAGVPDSPDCSLSADDPIPRMATELPTQGDSVVAGIDPIDYINKQLQDILKPPSTEDYLAVRDER